MRRDHPRRCGENFRNNPVAKDIPGSPPQVRGKQCDKLFEKPTYGITPAGAGKTSRRNANACLSWDHPRRCGENCFVLGTNLVNLGSPPQVRGKRNARVKGGKLHGITPAGAGKTAYTTKLYQ